jgi:uncharacterized membrane protein
MHNNLPLTITTLIVVGLIVWLVFYFEKKRPEWTFALRKILHIVVIFLAALGSWFLPLVLVVTVSWIATICVYIAIKANRFSEVLVNGNQRKPWGMLYFCMLYAILNSVPLFAVGESDRLVNMLRLSNVFAFVVLALADGFAGLLGRMFSVRGLSKNNGFNRVKLGNDEKTWFGFLIFALITFSVSIVFLDFCGVDGFGSIVELAMFAILVAVIEMVSSGGSDNLFVVLVSWLFAIVASSGILFDGYFELFYQSDVWLLGYFILSSIAAIMLAKMGWLKPSGAAMAWLLAFAVNIMACWSLAPLVVFLVIATTVGKVRKIRENNSAGDLKSNKPRDHWQVLANGGLFMVFALLSYLQEFGFFQFLMALFSSDHFNWIAQGFGDRCFFLALLSLSVSSSDTLSSEIGQWLGGTPRSILTGVRTQKGVSGGVTVAGFFGAILGSVMIAVFVFLHEWQTDMFGSEWLLAQGFGVIVVAGFFGTILDSLLGDLIQAKFKNGEGLWSDKPWPGQSMSMPTKGFGFVTNDLVNALTGVIVVGLLIYYWICG